MRVDFDSYMSMTTALDALRNSYWSAVERYRRSTDPGAQRVWASLVRDEGLAIVAMDVAAQAWRTEAEAGQRVVRGCTVNKCDCCGQWLVWCDECDAQIGMATPLEMAELKREAHEGNHRSPA